MEEKYHSLLQVSAKHVKMIEIFRQLKNQAMLFALRVKDGRTIFCVQTTQCAVPKESKLG